MDVYLKTSLHDHVVARVEAKHTVTPGAAITAYVDMSKVHIFEPGETGANLTREAATSSNNEQSESSHAVA